MRALRRRIQKAVDDYCKVKMKKLTMMVCFAAVAANAQVMPPSLVVAPPITNGPTCYYDSGMTIMPMQSAKGWPYGLVTLSSGFQFKARALTNSDGSVFGWEYNLPQPPQTRVTVTGSGAVVSCETNLPGTKLFEAVAYPVTTNRFKVRFTSDLMADWAGTAGYFTGSNNMLAIKSEPIIY